MRVIQAAVDRDDMARTRSVIKNKLRHRDMFGEQRTEAPFSGTKSPQSHNDGEIIRCKCEDRIAEICSLRLNGAQTIGLALPAKK